MVPLSVASMNHQVSTLMSWVHAPSGCPENPSEEGVFEKTTAVDVADSVPSGCAAGLKTPMPA